ncbi:MAG: hypothetical protein AB7S98_23345 [Burkholderiaceae bacterium]
MSLPAQADYLWLKREGAVAEARVGELHKPLTQLPALLEARTPGPDGKPLPLDLAADRIRFAPAAAGDLRFTAMRPDANGVLTYFHARFGRSETQAVNDLELVPTEPGGNKFRLIFKGRPVAASHVNVETSEGWRRTLTPAQDGTVGFDPSFPGLYLLTVTARLNNGSVTLDGKTYSDVRHTATLSFEVAPR